MRAMGGVGEKTIGEGCLGEEGVVELRREGETGKEEAIGFLVRKGTREEICV